MVREIVRVEQSNAARLADDWAAHRGYPPPREKKHPVQKGGATVAHTVGSWYCKGPARVRWPVGDRGCPQGASVA